MSSASAIKNNIDRYCSDTSSDPVPSETITLQNPIKEGYTFAGWYRDAEFTIPISQIVKGSSGDLTLYAKWESSSQDPGDEEIIPDVLGNGTIITLEYDTVTYNGEEQTPEAIIRHSDKMLVQDKDYVISYYNNLNAGVALVSVTGINDYHGSASKNFTILPAKLVITAKDKILWSGDPKPAPEEYEYQIEGLVEGESLLTPPTFICDAQNPVQKGIYEEK